MLQYLPQQKLCYSLIGRLFCDSIEHYSTLAVSFSSYINFNLDLWLMKATCWVFFLKNVRVKDQITKAFYKKKVWKFIFYICQFSSLYKSFVWPQVGVFILHGGFMHSHNRSKFIDFCSHQNLQYSTPKTICYRRKWKSENSIFRAESHVLQVRDVISDVKLLKNGQK